MWYGHNSRPLKAALGLYAGSVGLFIVSFLASLPHETWFTVVSLLTGIGTAAMAIIATVILVVDYLDTV